MGRLPYRWSEVHVSKQLKATISKVRHLPTGWMDGWMDG
jgi:hypothetical protein